MYDHDRLLEMVCAELRRQVAEVRRQRLVGTVAYRKGGDG